MVKETTPQKLDTPTKFTPETLFSKFKRKTKKVFQNVTLEPVMMFMSFVGSMDSVSIGQMTIEKSCANDFFYNETICNNLLNDAYNHENAAVQSEVAQYKVYESIVDHLFPILCSFFLGSWSDTFGRKILLYIYFVFRMVEGSMLLLNAYFIEWPKEYLLFSVCLPVALSGGGLAYSMGMNAFIADISSPEQRSFRMAMMQFVKTIGRPFGVQAGAYLYDKGGYVCVFSATLIGRILSFVFLVVRLEMFNWKSKHLQEKEQKNTSKRHHPLSPRHIIDSIKVSFKKRTNGKRFYLWVYLLVHFNVILPFYGESVIGYNYVRTRYNWEVQDYSNFITLSEIFDIVGQSICIPLLGIFSIRDSLIVPFLLSCIIIRDFVKGFGEAPWMFYFGSAINIMCGYSFSACRSIVSKCVDSDEIGKVFALLASLESLVPIGMSQVYASIWDATQDLGSPLVGTVFYLSGTLTTVALLVSILSLLRLNGKAIADLDDTPLKNPKYSRPAPRMPDMSFDSFDNGAATMETNPEEVSGAIYTIPEPEEDKQKSSVQDK